MKIVTLAVIALLQLTMNIARAEDLQSAWERIKSSGSQNLESMRVVATVPLTSLQAKIQNLAARQVFTPAEATVLLTMMDKQI